MDFDRLYKNEKNTKTLVHPANMPGNVSIHSTFDKFWEGNDLHKVVENFE